METPKLLSVQYIENDRKTVFVDTLYGGQVGLRRMTTGQVMKALPLFASVRPDPEGPYVDPLGVGFLDVECPACAAEMKEACDSFGLEAVPHDARARLAKEIRYARACRIVLRNSIVFPAVSNQLLEHLETKPEALVDLITTIMRINGLAPEAQAQMESDFRPGTDEPAAVHEGSEPGVPVPASPDA